MDTLLEGRVSIEVLNFCELGLLNLDEIMLIEEAVYSHPWSRGNFFDSFNSQHDAWGLRDQHGVLLAYFLLMPVLDEFHLLTFAVTQAEQKKGYARILLEKMLEFARARQFVSILLEVRVSNQRALSVYRRFGFIEIGRRKGYYASENFAREDAIVMRLLLNDEK
jgi:ribosomal-protein-alanine N-acetyltransferase